MDCYEASPTIREVVLRDNFARYGGGGMECHTQSSPELTNVIFLHNSTRGGDIAGGGALYCCYGSRPVLTDCLFEGSTSYRWGGAIHCRNASPYFTGCTIANNSSDTYAGGVWFHECSPAFTNVTFYGNSAPNASDIYGTSHEAGWVATFDNVIVASGKLSRSVGLGYQAGAVFTCCNIYGNEVDDWPSEIQDQYGIRGNFSACPSFCFADMGDFHLCDESPCLPGNHPDGYDCGLIGAWGEGCSCGPTRTQPATWGAIKSLYR
ncbi:MAG: right-handed parallel beta-helix repeat-containing protein [Candidatus Eisenbacteria bacterium]